MKFNGLVNSLSVLTFAKSFATKVDAKIMQYQEILLLLLSLKHFRKRGHLGIM